MLVATKPVNGYLRYPAVLRRKDCPSKVGYDGRETGLDSVSV